MNDEMPATTPSCEYCGPSSALSRGTPRMTAGGQGEGGGGEWRAGGVARVGQAGQRGR